jgi:hypothetical protein
MDIYPFGELVVETPDGNTLTFTGVWEVSVDNVDREKKIKVFYL